MTSKDVRYYFVGNYTGATGLSSGSRLDAYDDLSDGEMIVVDAENYVHSDDTLGGSAGAVTDDVVQKHGLKVAFRSGTNLYFTPLMKKENLLSYNGTDTGAAQEQISYIGYAGSGSNSIDLISNNVYVPRINFWSEGRQGFSTPHIVTTAYKSGDNPTQLNVATKVALGLQNSFDHQRKTGKDKSVKTEVVCDHAGTGLDSSSGTGTITATKGSKYISAATDIDAVMSVGDLWRAGTATTSPVYKIVSFDTTNNNAKLDRAYEGDSGTFAEAANEYITSTQAASANFGIKLTGIAKTFTDPKKHTYEKVKFDVDLDGWGDTTVTEDQAAERGTGTYEAVAEAEYLYYGNLGTPYRGDFIHSSPMSNATSGELYKVLSIGFYDDTPTNSLGNTRSPIEVSLAFKAGYDAGQAPDYVISTLDYYFGLTSGIAAS